MNATPRILKTRRGEIRLPAYVPVITFGTAYPLDNLIRPYLPRLAPAVMVSVPLARDARAGDARAGDTTGSDAIQEAIEDLRVPLFVNSGGFLSLRADAQVREERTLGVLECPAGEEGDVIRIHPLDVLNLQERIADVAFTLDFPIAPETDRGEAERRQRLTIANAHWALANRRRRDLPLYAGIQAWDVASARACAQAYAGAAFDGFAVGGLVPRLRDFTAVLDIVAAVRGEIGDRPLHAFGLGAPEIVAAVFQAGVDSVDSSSYVQLAADGRLWSNPALHIEEPTPTDRLHLAICNLALATGCSLPVSASGLLFHTTSPLRRLVQ